MGAKPTQGSHHGAQKSTTTGVSLWINAKKLFVVPSIGFPSNSFSLHEPHVAVSSMRSVGMRFIALQCGQRVVIVFIVIIRFLAVYFLELFSSRLPSSALHLAVEGNSGM
jgi:hypothetical protein